MAYITVDDIRDAGLEDDERYPDDAVEAAIDIWSRYIDEQTRQWFEARSMTALIDGNDSDTLHLPVPIISVSELYTNARFESVNVLPTSDYSVYNRVMPDDRRNPKIKLVNQRESAFVFPSLYPRGRRFSRGRQNQKIVGVFGFVDLGVGDDDEVTYLTPPLIKRAVKKLVLRNIEPMATLDGPDLGVLDKPMPAASESADGHSISYLTPDRFKLKAPTLAITGDLEVDKIISMYKGPIIVAVPGCSWLENG